MTRWWNVRRFDLVEVTLLVAAVLAVSWLEVRQQVRAEHVFSPEALSLRSVYGPDRNSENEEEWIVRDFFRDKRNGFFVDVGANDYKRYSNTFYLETQLGWSGIAIEPQREFEVGYLEHRPRTRFRPFFVSDSSNETAKLYVGTNRLVTSSNKPFTERFGKDIAEVSAITITLDDLLEHEDVRSVDFISMDIELWEPKALAGFDIERFKPSLVCVEAHPEVRQQILNYFARHRYVAVGKYLRADTHNLYFTPLE